MQNRLFASRIILFAALVLTLYWTKAHAQCNRIMSDNIASLQVVAGNNWLAMPIIKLNGEECINISFDDFSHEHKRYAYKLEHCEADWSVSQEIFDSDFCEGFTDGCTIEDSEESINTNTIYTHYRLQIPNTDCKIKASGNYRLTIYDENEKDTIAEACFCVLEPVMHIELSASGNTDIDTNGQHQQLTAGLKYNGINIINPAKEIYTVFLQNGRWDNAKICVVPQYATNNGMRWEHNKSLIFDGGNEYHKFEILDVSHPGLGIENIQWDGENYQAHIWPDLPRKSYVYDKDANGAFYIRNSDNIENDISSEYVETTFRLQTTQHKETIYINGVWTNGDFSDKYAMKYNASEGIYENKVKLKQGYYSYQYLMKRADGSTAFVPTEGNFHQTENSYQMLVYCKTTGQRTFRLVGYKETYTP